MIKREEILKALEGLEGGSAVKKFIYDYVVELEDQLMDFVVEPEAPCYESPEITDYEEIQIEARYEAYETILRLIRNLQDGDHLSFNEVENAIMSKRDSL